MSEQYAALEPLATFNHELLRSLSGAAICGLKQALFFADDCKKGKDMVFSTLSAQKPFHPAEIPSAFQCLCTVEMSIAR